MTRADYRLFTENAPDLPVFFEDWFLEAVGEGGSWQFVSAEKSGKTVATWPFFVKKRGFWRYSAVPKMARLLGPFLKPEVRGGDGEQKILKDLIEKLPRHLAAFEQDFHYSIQNWLPFFWKKWRQTTRYSFRVSLENDLEKAFEKLDSDYRRRIKNVDGALVFRTDFSARALFECVQKSYARQSIEAGFSLAFLEKLVAAAEKAGRGRAFFAADAKSGEVAAAAFLLWDSGASYLLMLGDDEKHRKNAPAIWLTWRLIEFSKNEIGAAHFDFLGSMVEPIERVRRKFGAEQTPYFRLQKEWSPIFRLGKMLFR